MTHQIIFHFANQNDHPNHNHYEKNECFAIGFTTQFLSCNDHFQSTIFLHCECYQTSYIYINATHYNSIATLSKQLIFNYYVIPL